MTDTPKILSDLQLAKNAVTDSQSEAIILRRLYPKMFQIARTFSRDRAQADDIAQMSAMELVKSLRKYRGTGSLEAFAGRIAYRTAMRLLKRRRNREGITMPLMDTDWKTEETPETRLSKQQLFNRLIENMECIPQKRRVPLLLHLAYGYTVKEVSELTDTSANTVKDRLKTGVRELQRILDAHPDLCIAMLEELS